MQSITGYGDALQVFFQRDDNPLDLIPVEAPHSNDISGAERAPIAEVSVKAIAFQNVQLYKAQIRNLTGSQRVEQLEFIERYQRQIYSACELVSHCTLIKNLCHGYNEKICYT